MMEPEPRRDLRVVFQPDWDPGAADAARRGLLAADSRVRTLLRVVVSYPEVRYVLPDRICLDATADRALVETLGRFLARQTWLVKSVIAH
jgi:hypothetical protein